MLQRFNIKKVSGPDMISWNRLCSCTSQLTRVFTFTSILRQQTYPPSSSTGLWWAALNIFDSIYKYSLQGKAAPYHHLRQLKMFKVSSVIQHTFNTGALKTLVFGGVFLENYATVVSQRPSQLIPRHTHWLQFTWWDLGVLVNATFRAMNASLKRCLIFLNVGLLNVGLSTILSSSKRL